MRKVTACALCWGSKRLQDFPKAHLDEERPGLELTQRALCRLLKHVLQWASRVNETMNTVCRLSLGSQGAWVPLLLVSAREILICCLRFGVFIFPPLQPVFCHFSSFSVASRCFCFVFWIFFLYFCCSCFCMELWKTECFLFRGMIFSVVNYIVSSWGSLLVVENSTGRK